MPTVIEQLQKLVDDKRLAFDSDLLRRALLGIPPAQQVSARAQVLVVALCEKVPSKTIKISSLWRNSGHHGEGRAVGVGNEDIAKDLLPLVATSAEVKRLGIDELIFDAGLIAGEADRNKYNFDDGDPHKYDATTLNEHRNHIHFSVVG